MSTRTILISGVGKRLGLALAHHFIENKWQVIGTYRTHYNTIDQLTALGADLYQVDFYQQHSVDAFIQQITAVYSSLDCLIHNASDWLPDNVDKPAHEIIERMMTIHANIPYQLNLAFKSLLINSKQENSDIVHITDYVTSKGSKKHMAYAASKAALDNLTLSFATLYAPKVKVNAIAPGLLKFNEKDDDTYKAKTLKKALIEHEGGFDEVVKTINYLIESNYVTGRTFHVDGGRHLK